MNYFSQKAFTLIEIILVMIIVLSLGGFVTFDMLKSRNSASIDQTVQLLISDIKNQQFKMMSGNPNNLSLNTPYGIHFDESQYTLFQNTTYSENNATNYRVLLGSDLRFSDINLPNSEILFASLSGEIQNYNQNQNTITLENINNLVQKVITINRNGVITTVQ